MKGTKDIRNSSECFDLLLDKELAFLNDKKTQLTYLQGENIFKQGAFAPYVLFIIDGLVKVFLQTGHNKQMNIRLATAGDFLAFSSIYGENIYRYSTLALKDSTVCMIDKTALNHLLLKNNNFAMHITAKNSKNEAHLLEIIKNITYKQMRGKLASSLLYLASNDFVKENVFQYLTRQDIADFAAITAESAIKFLKEFEKEDILKLEGKKIKITNNTKLEDISKRG